MMISRYNMRIKNNDKTYFRAVCIVLFSLAFTGCTKDGLNEFGPGNATGKVVMVSLNVSLPPIEEPTSTSEYTTVKPFLRNESSSDSSFTVVLEREQRRFLLPADKRLNIFNALGIHCCHHFRHFNNPMPLHLPIDIIIIHPL